MKCKPFIFIILSISLIAMLVSCAKQNTTQGHQTETNDSDTDELVLAIGNEPDSEFWSDNWLGSLWSLSWIEEIQTDAKFSDGEPLTTEEIVFTYETAKKSGSVIDLFNLDKTIRQAINIAIDCQALVDVV